MSFLSTVRTPLRTPAAVVTCAPPSPTSVAVAGPLTRKKLRDVGCNLADVLPHCLRKFVLDTGGGSGVITRADRLGAGSFGVVFRVAEKTSRDRNDRTRQLVVKIVEIEFAGGDAEQAPHVPYKGPLPHPFPGLMAPWGVSMSSFEEEVAVFRKTSRIRVSPMFHHASTCIINGKTFGFLVSDMMDRRLDEYIFHISRKDSAAERTRLVTQLVDKLVTKLFEMTSRLSMYILDLHQHNIMVDSDGTPFIVDLGVHYPISETDDTADVVAYMLHQAGLLESKTGHRGGDAESLLRAAAAHLSAHIERRRGGAQQPRATPSSVIVLD